MANVTNNAKIHFGLGERPEKEQMQSDPINHVPKFPGMIGTFMGRDALSLALSSLKLDSRDKILLPVYTCQEVLKSFSKRVSIVFYDIRPDLSIDPDEIRAKLHDQKIGMMLVTDYFGFLQPYRRELRALCDEHGVSLIEDCAHSLLTRGAGELGDYAIFSQRKLLPVPDGGGLRINKQSASLIPEFYPEIYSNTLSLTAIIKSRLNIHTEMLSRGRVASQAKKVVPIAAETKAKQQILPLSYFTYSGLRKLSFDEVIRKRRDDFQFWREVCFRNPFLEPVFPDLPDQVCPFGFPVLVEQQAVLETRARKAGMPLSVHWRLEKNLAPECSTSHQLSKRMLTLPLFPYITDKKREALARVLSEEGLRSA